MGGDVALDQLEYDSSAYDMIHFMKVEWPCLSFDVIRDALGNNRQRVRLLFMTKLSYGAKYAPVKFLCSPEA